MPRGQWTYHFNIFFVSATSRHVCDNAKLADLWRRNDVCHIRFRNAGQIRLKFSNHL